eukprot:7851005-Pyramimonas_sp.AAC.1
MTQTARLHLLLTESAAETDITDSSLSAPTSLLHARRLATSASMLRWKGPYHCRSAARAASPVSSGGGGQAAAAATPAESAPNAAISRS